SRCKGRIRDPYRPCREGGRAARIWRAFDEQHLKPQRRAGDGGRHASRTSAENDEVVFRLHVPCHWASPICSVMRARAVESTVSSSRVHQSFSERTSISIGPVYPVASTSFRMRRKSIT